jgi:hypothetical protein
MVIAANLQIDKGDKTYLAAVLYKGNGNIVGQIVTGNLGPLVQPIRPSQMVKAAK